MRNTYQYNGTIYPKIIGDSTLSEKLDGLFSLSKSKLEEVQSYLILFFPFRPSQFDWTHGLQKNTKIDGFRNQYDLQTGFSSGGLYTDGLNDFNLSSLETITGKMTSGFYPDGTARLRCNDELNSLAGITGKQYLEAEYSSFLNTTVNTDAIWDGSKFLAEHRPFEGSIKNTVHFDKLHLQDEKVGFHTAGLDPLYTFSPETITGKMALGFNLDSTARLRCDDDLNPLVGITGKQYLESEHSSFLGSTVNTDAMWHGSTVLAEHRLLEGGIENSAHSNGLIIGDESSSVSYTRAVGIDDTFNNISFNSEGRISALSENGLMVNRFSNMLDVSGETFARIRGDLQDTFGSDANMSGVYSSTDVLLNDRAGIYHEQKKFVGNFSEETRGKIEEIIEKVMPDEYGEIEYSVGYSENGNNYMLNINILCLESLRGDNMQFGHRFYLNC